MNRLTYIFILAAMSSLVFSCQQVCAWQSLPVGFDAADADKSGGVSAPEMEKYLAERLKDEDLKHQKIFDRIDANDDDLISSAEFVNRHEAIEHAMGADYLGGGGDPMDDIEDPGKDFVPYTDSSTPTHDGKIIGAIFNRFEELAKDNSIKWPAKIKLSKVPQSLDSVLSQDVRTERPSIDDLVKSTVVIGGGSGMDFFTAGAVLISEDGLAVTNYHVAEFLKSGKMAALTHDGKCHPVVEFLAGNADRDVALIRIQGSGFTYVKVATSSPKVGDNIELVHHSENRFYTYDRGYVMRYPILGQNPWMEISADYAPGGSGCGIFNENRELVGLVSIIQFGDGPSLADNFDMQEEGEWFGDEEAEQGSGDGQMNTMLLVKHAVPQSAIRSLWKDAATSRSGNGVRSKKAKREMREPSN